MEINKEVRGRVREELIDFIVDRRYEGDQTGLLAVPDSFDSVDHYRETLKPHVWEQLRRRIAGHLDAGNTSESVSNLQKGVVVKLTRVVNKGCVEIGLKDLTYGADLAVVKIGDQLGVLTQAHSQCFRLNFPRSVGSSRVTMVFLDSMSEVFKSLYALEVMPSLAHNDTILGKTFAYHNHDELAVELADRHGLEHAQAVAVSRFMGAASGIQILQGPPGTGKTQTIVAVIKEVLREAADRKIVVCTPANAGLHSLAEKLVAARLEFDIVARQEKIPSCFHQHVVGAQEKHTKKIILCTLAKCLRLSTTLRDVDVIVDEAGQATDPITLLAFLFNPRRCLLVGDTKQLPPYIERDNRGDHNFGRSMMERLETVQQTSNFLPHTLQTSFRCTADMLSFPNKHFYKGRLESRVSRTLLPEEGLMMKSYFMIDVPDGHSKEKGKGMINRKEARAVIQFAEFFLTRPGITPDDIVVLCDYNDQKNHIEKELEKKKMSGIRVITVDGSQGNQYRIVFVSFARTLPTAGFLKSPNRLNVKLTRAMECLVLFGKFSALEKMGRNNIIGKLTNDLMSRRLKQSLESCIVLPEVAQILNGVGHAMPNYFDIIQLPYEATLRVKKAEACSLSSTINEDLLRRAAESFGLADPSLDSAKRTIKLFAARKHSQILEGDRVDGLKVLFTLAEFHMLVSEKEYSDYLSQFEGYYNDHKYPLLVRLFAKTTAVWIRYRVLALKGSDIELVLPEYDALDQEYRDARLPSTKHLLQWGIVLLRLGKYGDAAEKFRQVAATAVAEIHALNFDDVYSAMCLRGEILHRYADTKNKKRELIAQFEEAKQLSLELSMPRSWAYEMLAGYYMDCKSYYEANRNAWLALYRHGGNVHAWRVLRDSREKLR